MNTKTWILVALALAVLAPAGAWYLLTGQSSRDAPSVSISTDKEIYSVGEPVRITIRNHGHRTVDIYCPSWCALGNFPTTVERWVGGKWEYYAGFCPSIEPLFGAGDPVGDYIRHALDPGETFHLEISNFEALHLEKEEKLRIVYYLGGSKQPVYSEVFTVNP